MSQAVLAALPTRRSRGPVSFFEFWPGWLFYTPVVLYWIIQSIRYGSATLPSLSNPRIAAGGICGESKNQILDLAGPIARPWVADYAAVTTLGHADADDLPVALAAMAQAGLSFPVVAKPDMSCNGVGVRVVRDEAQLAAYLKAFPRATALQLQRLIAHEGEAGIFYIRHPGEARGRITSVTLKYPPSVLGDGRSTLRQLIAADERLNAVSHLLLPRLKGREEEVPAPGAQVTLVFVGNHCRGSTFKDGFTIVTPALEARIDEIMRDVRDVHFSRIDLRFESVEALREGRGFSIIEFNGAASEATNIWDPEMTLTKAYREQFFHYGEAFRIGAALRAQGLKPVGLWKLAMLWRQQKQLMRAYPSND